MPRWQGGAIEVGRDDQRYPFAPLRLGAIADRTSDPSRAAGVLKSVLVQRPADELGGYAVKMFHSCPHPTTRHGGLGAAVLVVLAAGDKTGKKCPAHLPLRGRQAS